MQGPPRSRPGEEPLNQNLFYKLAARSRPSRPALHLTDGATVSFGELFRQSGQVANALVAMGVKPGDRVAVQVEKSVSALVLYLAVLRAGAVFLPLNTSYTLNELTYFVGDVEPTVIVCDPSVECQLVLLPGLRGVIKTLDARGSGTLTTASSSLNDEFATVTRDADDLAAILYTSGTTGRAKGQGCLVLNGGAAVGG